MKRRALMVAGLGFALSLASGGAWSQASSGAMAPQVVPPESLSVPSQGSGVGDSVITARAKMALLRADNLDTGDVHVATHGSIVTLSGHVANAAQKQKAGDVVGGLDGVTAVRNELEVKATSK
ncbi:BON domain-containing protein [Trinickia diaoshuihuensis]|jgi:hypothetical protein|uniref:BON domain-containing protein n=1 Tax=Trinickia diaoshuihuensis TaxID=2292265 RepID=UPI0013C31B22|nr:BON domain-containing protein [Trinickia diaoshuihuensis]